MATKKASKGGARKAGAKKGGAKKAAASAGLSIPRIPNPCVQKCIITFARCLSANPGNAKACAERLARCVANCV